MTLAEPLPARVLHRCKSCKSGAELRFQTILSTILHLNRDISYGGDLLLIAGKINYCAFERLYSEPHPPNAETLRQRGVN